MNPQIIQNLRYKLQKRICRLNSVNKDMFVHTLRQFLAFFDSNPTYIGIVESLSRKFPNTDNDINRIINGDQIVGKTEEESAAIGYSILKRIDTQLDVGFCPRLTRSYGYTKIDESLKFIRDTFIEPFYEYVDEQLNDQGATLSLLLRYKHRSEWFYRGPLMKLASLDFHVNN